MANVRVGSFSTYCADATSQSCPLPPANDLGRAAARSQVDTKTQTHVTIRVCLLRGVGLANLFEELEVRRLPSHHSSLLLCRQRCTHPVDVEVQPCAGLTNASIS